MVDFTIEVEVIDELIKISNKSSEHRDALINLIGKERYSAILERYELRQNTRKSLLSMLQNK